MFSLVNSAMLDSKILIFSGTIIRVIFQNLLTAISNLESSADSWQVKFNPVKCLHVVITNKRSYIQNTPVPTNSIQVVHSAYTDIQ